MFGTRPVEVLESSGWTVLKLKPGEGGIHLALELLEGAVYSKASVTTNSSDPNSGGTDEGRPAKRARPDGGSSAGLLDSSLEAAEVEEWCDCNILVR
jgi:hypothetical protein